MYPYYIMACYYYITTSIIIEYMSKDNRYCTITTDNTREKRYLVIPPEYCGCAMDTPNKINDFCIDILLKNTYKETLFAKNRWSSEDYKIKYSTKYVHIVPHIKEIIKVFKNVHASKYI